MRGHLAVKSLEPSFSPGIARGSQFRRTILRGPRRVGTLLHRHAGVAEVRSWVYRDIIVEGGVRDDIPEGIVT